MKKVFRILGNLIAFIILLAGVFVMFTALWVRRTWPKLSASSIIFQLQNSLEGTGNGMIGTFVLTTIVPTVILTAAVVFLFFFFRKHRKLITLTSGLMGVALFVLAICLLWNRIGLGDYLKYRNKKSTFIEDNYVDPDKVDIRFPDKKRNIIYIYLESMELAYADTENGGNMDENLIPNLTKLEEVGEDFAGNDSKILNGAYSMYGTDWTMGAMFAETSGLPLIIPIQKNSMFTQSKFFPTVKTFGDILEDHGYKNVFLIGSDARFGGRDLYFSSHGNYEIEDYEYARKNGWIPEDYMVFWGYEDEKLFGFARSRLGELATSEQPFNMTILTVDTHFDDGYTCRLCEDKYKDSYMNAIACSDRQVADFVSWCRGQDFYENTTIIISGDHPTMDMDMCYVIDKSYDRKVYVSIINPAEGLEASNKSRAYTTFDLFPTSLAAIGVKIEGDRLGLGTNLYSDEPTLLESKGYKEFNTQLQMKSVFMDRLAEVDEASGESFLDEVDQILKEMNVNISCEKNGGNGEYLVRCIMLSDNPSSLNYIKDSYITVSDGTYECSYTLEYDNDYSISEGKTSYTVVIKLPLTENIEREDAEDDSFFNKDKNDDSEKDVEDYTNKDDAKSDPYTDNDLNSIENNDNETVKSYKITVRVNLYTNNKTTISEWEETFIIK